MKKLLTLILCWLLAFEAFGATTFKAKTAASVAGGYVTSLNKVDGSFEDGSTQWSASVGTIVPTASTEFQGNYKGVWAGTGTGTLDLQWTATASNTYEASAQVNVQGKNDVYVCAYVGTTETGCKLIPALNKIQKVSVVADSIISSAFNLRLKHTGSDAFSINVDDGKIEPWTPQAVNLVEQESVTYTGYISKDGTTVKLATKDTLRSNNSKLIEDTNNTFTKFKVLKRANVTVVYNATYSASRSDTQIFHYDSQANFVRLVEGFYIQNGYTGGANQATMTVMANAGDYFVAVESSATPLNSQATSFSITATAISDNVVQSWQPSGSLGELKFLPQNIAPQGFIPALGSSIGKTAGTYQGDAYYNLYALLWSMSSTTAGEPYVISSAKGANAATDWAANKTITIDVSGLVVRAYKSGTTAEVGAKQLDAFQDHQHTQQGAGTGSGNDFIRSGLSSVTAATSPTGYSLGVFRAASETRMTNIAQYAFIRYGNDAPTLLALPTSKINEFSANFDVISSITQKSSDWIESISISDTSLVRINFKAGLFTVLPTVTLGTFDNTVLADPRATIAGVSTSYVDIRTGYSTSTQEFVKSLRSFQITVTKNAPDYTAPGVFVGNVQPEWQYDLSVSGTNWNTTRAVGVVYKMASGQYRMRFTVVGTVSSQASNIITINGVTFKNTSGYLQPLSVTSNIGNWHIGRCAANASTIELAAGASVTRWEVSGDVELESKPTWATMTP